MPDGLAPSVYVQALLAGGTDWWFTAGYGTTPTATNGLSGAQHILTYSFLTSDYSGDTGSTNFRAMGPNEQAVVKSTLAYISSLFDLKFVQVAAGAGEINYGTNDQGSVSAGYANYANSDNGHANVMISNDATYGYGEYSDYSPGSYAFMVLIHETGHALGLKHPGNYNAGSDNGTPGPYLPYDMDDRQYSVMSYNNASNSYGATYSGYIYPSSYQLYDFYALQYLYGANTTTAPSNQTFSWSTTTVIYQTLYAIGSNNTIDLSDLAGNSTLNLNDGTFSSIVEPYGLGTGTNDLAIAPNAQIDTAKLGSGSDALIANNDGDTIYLGTGFDTVTGGSGNDLFYLSSGGAYIYGAGGTDVVYAVGAAANYTFTNSAGTVGIQDGSQSISLVGISSIVFSDRTVNLLAAAPTITAPSTTISGANTLIALSTLLSVVDPDGLPASELTYTLTDNPAVGEFFVGGVASSVSSITLTAATFAQSSYLSKLPGGVDTITVTVSDGLASATTAFSITTPGFGVTPHSIATSLRGQTYAASTLFTAFDSFGTIAFYTIEDVNTDNGGGYFILNGQAQTSNTPFLVLASQLPTLTYVSPIVGTERVSVTATSNTGTTAQSNVYVFGPTAAAPSIQSVSTTTLPFGPQGSVALSSLVSATDNNGLPSSDLLYSFTSLEGAGSFYVNGVNEGTSVQNLTSAQFAETTYVRTGLTASDDISVSVQDGTGVSTSTYLFVLTAAPVAPTLTVPSETLNSALSPVAIASFASISDPNGASSANFTYSLSYSGSGGVLDLNGTSLAMGQTLFLSETSFLALSYVPSLYGGTDNFTLTLLDGYVSSAAATFSITSPSAPGPVFTATNAAISATRDQIFSTSSASNPLGFFTETNADVGASIVQYVFDVVPGAGGVGSFFVGGVLQTDNSPFFVSPGDLNSVTYQSVAGTETIWIRGNDGTVLNPHWGAWSSVTVTAPPPLPGVVFTPVSAGVNATRDQVFSNPLSLWTENNTTGAAIAQYGFFVADTAGGVGSFLLSGIAQPNDTTITVNASDLGTVSFQSVSGTETIYIRANDGTLSDPNWGAWSAITVTAPAPLPGAAFTPVNATIAPSRGAVISNALSLWNETDTSGAPISQYEFFGGTAVGATGGFSVSGAAMANGQVILVSAADVGTVSYKAYSGSQTIYVRANDGTVNDPNWGNWSVITVNAPAVTVAPVFTPVNVAISMTRDQINTNPVALWTESDASGGIISQYQVFDDDTAGGVGNFFLNGVLLGNDTTQTINVSQIGTLTYQAVSGKQTIYVRANDGTIANPIWGNWSPITVTAPAPLPGAAFTPANATLSSTRGAVFSNALSLWNETDTSGAPISQYEFFGGSTTGGIGEFSVGSTAFVNGQIVLVSAANVGTVSYQAFSGSQTIYVRANDGTVTDPNWGNWSVITVNAPAVTVAPVFTPVNAAITMMRDQINPNPIALWTQSDASGGTISQYQVFDDDTAGGVGNFFLNGTLFTNDTTQTIDISQIGTLTYQAVSGKQTIYVRANDSTAANPIWGNWSPITITAPPPLPAATFTPVSSILSPSRDVVLSNALSLWTETDTSGAPISQYEFFGGSTSGGAGAFSVGSSVFANGTVVLVGAANVGTVSYQAYSGSQTIYVRANDGTVADPNWGNWSVITVNAPIATALPVFTPVNATIAMTRDQINVNPLALWNESDASGGTISQYQVFDDDTAPGVGNFSLGGTLLANDTTQTIDPSLINTLTYQAVSGKQTIYIRANDGTAAIPFWGNWSPITVTAPAATAVATFTPVHPTISMERDQINTNPLALWSESDASGSAISQYQVFDSDADGVGNWLLNGVNLGNDMDQTITASQISSLSYQPISGNQTISIRANDGTAETPVWGAWSSVTVNAPWQSVNAVFTPVSPLLIATAGEIFSAPSSLFSESDASGGTISQYRFEAYGDPYNGGVGDFFVNGVAQALQADSYSFVIISTSDLSTLSFQIQSGQIYLDVEANDGTVSNPDWGVQSGLHISVPSSSPTAAPVAARTSPVIDLAMPGLSQSLSLAAGSVVSPASLLNHAVQQSSPLLAIHHA